MRNVNTGPYWLSWCMMKVFGHNLQRWKQLLIPVLTLLLTVTTTVVQFTSTILVSDLGPDFIPGSSKSSTLATNFEYGINDSVPTIYRASTWTLKPPFHPTFAEISRATKWSKYSKRNQ